MNPEPTETELAAQQAADYAEEVALLDAIYAATERLLSKDDPTMRNHDAVVRRVLGALNELGR